jgi:hypothetical protein
VNQAGFGVDLRILKRKDAEGPQRTPRQVRVFTTME